MRTTDPQDELFEIYDADGQPTGRVKPRGQVHRDGDWHRSIHIWIWRIDAGLPSVIFQRRSLTKDTWPGAIDVAVGGHIRAGETLAETVREAEEEIGLKLTLPELTPLGRRFQLYADDAFIDAEINDVFAYRCDQPLACYQLKPDEVASLVSIPLEAGLRLFDNPATERITATEQAPDRPPAQIELRFEDFTYTGDDYPQLALQAIHRLATNLPITPFLIRP